MSSCNFISFKPKIENTFLDTIIDFSKVDTSPSFKNCDSLIDVEKTTCFRNTIHKKITNELAKHKLASKHSMNEIVYVQLLISNSGKLDLVDVISSEKVKKYLPTLDSLLKLSVENIDKLQPANKRGIPVITQYSLPVRILLED